MRRLAPMLVLAVASQAGALMVPDPSAALQEAVVVEETVIDRQVREIASELRCPVCQGLSLQDSPSELAQEMRDVVRGQLEEGKTVDEVKAYFVASYGEWILLEPTARGFNLTVYLLPVVAVLGGALLLLVVARRWLNQAAPVEADAVEEEPDPDLAPWEDIGAR